MFNKILSLFVLQFFLLSGLWAIDIGVTGICFEEYGTANAQGLGFIRSANSQYHLGLGIIYVVFFIQVAWLLYSIVGERKCRESIRWNRNI